MIDPVIYTIGNFSLRWYGVIVMIGVIVGSLIVERELKRRGENPESIWDALIWPWYFGPNMYLPLIGDFRLFLPRGVLILGIIGARLWYVMNDILGGNTRYLDDPSQIYKVWEGGLHIFGGFLFGAITLLWFLRSNKLDPWLFLDSAGPAMLIGQGIGRIANFINQELYGPPTTLPWGIQIQAANRLPEFRSLSEATRFHPTFAYEMLWNFATAGLLLWLSRRYEKQIKPGTLFAGWLLAAGIGRTWIELFFRPDQPKIGDSPISYSMIVAALMAIAGAVILMLRYKVIQWQAAEGWEEEYQISSQAIPVETSSTPQVKTVRKASTSKATATTKKPPRKKSKETSDEKVEPAARPTKRTVKTSAKKS